jgi:hypothetical protein
VTETVAGSEGWAVRVIWVQVKPAKKIHHRAPQSASPTTLPLIEHKHLHTSTTRALGIDRKWERPRLNDLTITCMIWAIFDMPPGLSTSGLRNQSHSHASVLKAASKLC